MLNPKHILSTYCQLLWPLAAFFLLWLFSPLAIAEASVATMEIAAASVAEVSTGDEADRVPADVATTGVVTKSSAPAANPSTYYSTMGGNSKPGSGGHLLSVTLALSLIVVLIVAVSWFIRRFSQGMFINSAQMKIIASLPLGTRERIMLVDVGGQQLLLGVTANQINTLHVFSEPIASPTPAATVSDFSRKLMSVLQQKNSQADTAANNNPPGQV